MDEKEVDGVRISYPAMQVLVALAMAQGTTPERVLDEAIAFYGDAFESFNCQKCMNREGC